MLINAKSLQDFDWPVQENGPIYWTGHINIQFYSIETRVKNTETSIKKIYTLTINKFPAPISSILGSCKNAQLPSA